MKKLVILLLATLMMTGCSVVPINNQSIDSIVDSILKENSELSNVSFEGYKYYLPKGVSLVEKSDYNAILLDNHNYYYLYVDAVSYYHHIDFTYEENKDAYFSKALSYQDKDGYIEITKSGENYFVEAMYHYAKIETFIKEDNLKDALTNIVVILSSVQYNDQVLATFVGDNILNYTEESFDIFKPKRDEGEFLEIVEEYGTFKDTNNELPDEDQIQIEEEIR